MSAPDAIRAATRDAYTDREGCGTSEAFDAAADAAYTATLHATYWKLREHASAYRNTKGFRSAMASWEADRHNDRRYASAVLHEWFAKGIEAAARDIAELLGTPEHEIEPIEP
ncbi:hypothetical protein AB0J14_04615 [Micromonospora arborensis]|uniref:hypothetical protein n=1 Tax=Micromonospora arborensis TaxID=2116518 RepID=UPI0033CB3BCC